jgi:hypothetical protein
MNRIEIPSCWILEVPSHELGEFEFLNENGQEVPIYQVTSFYIARRKRDGKVFKQARFRPAKSVRYDISNTFYLEEV